MGATMYARRFVLLTLVAAMWCGCGEDEDPPSIVSDLRILAISAEPADLASGEVMAFEALVTAPDETELTYRWEWCPFTEGADEFFECPIDDADPELAALFDLGSESTARLDSVTATLVLVSICEALDEGLEELGDYQDLLEYVELPDCDVGMDVTVRLTVSSPDQERIAIKRVFVWLSTPDELQRNRNPVIDSIDIDDEPQPSEVAIEAESEQEVDWYVNVPAESLEAYLLRSDSSADERRETITYDFYATAGEWEEDKQWGSFADDDFITREDAGSAALTLPAVARRYGSS